ncbi:MAG: SDR family oxidoreductase [Cyclobacteriaceae bacterium]|nr:SDR family oxidoreductase [Cyclobacteriaceae bacterium]
MKLLITGANGLLGQKLVRECDARGIEVIATGVGKNRNLPGQYHYVPLDICDPQQVKSAIAKFRPDVVINTAAMTQVDQCETDREACYTLNVRSVSYLIEACRESHSFLLHLSTDFIFDGKNGPYKETDEPNPLSYYAETKLESEKLLEASGIDWAIARTMLVYGIVHDMSRSNIILWVKQNLEQGKKIKVVNDQWRMPTLAEDLAKGCLLIAQKRAQGIFHLSGKDMLTPYNIAVATAEFFKLDPQLIEEVDGTVFSQTARRPARTGFVLDKARTRLGYEPVGFSDGIAILSGQLDRLSQ